jgi:methylenetetrahydrofolate reductase (NADPH)
MVIGNLTTTASPRRYPRGTDLTVATITPAQNKAAARALGSGFSLEMTGKDVPGLQEAAHSIPQGTKINVTFLGNEDLDMRVTAAKAVKDLGFVPVPHISARRLKSQDQLEEFLGRLQVRTRTR